MLKDCIYKDELEFALNLKYEISSCSSYITHRMENELFDMFNCNILYEVSTKNLFQQYLKLKQVLNHQPKRIRGLVLRMIRDDVFYEHMWGVVVDRHRINKLRKNISANH